MEQNTISGNIALDANITAVFDNDPVFVTSNVLLKFKLNLLSGVTGALTNLVPYLGKITPANQLHTIKTFLVTEKPNIFLIYVDRPIGILFTDSSPTLGAAWPYNAVLLRAGWQVIRRNYRQDFRPLYLELDTRTVLYADPADIDQAIDINYAIYTMVEA